MLANGTDVAAGLVRCFENNRFKASLPKSVRHSKATDPRSDNDDVGHDYQSYNVQQPENHSSNQAGDQRNCQPFYDLERLHIRHCGTHEYDRGNG